MTDLPWRTAPPLRPIEPNPTDTNLTPLVRGWLERIAANNQRSHQVEIGASEVGDPCDRRLSYRAHQAPRVHQPDPLRAMIGTAVHGYLAEQITRFNDAMFRVEHPIRYRSVPGSADLVFGDTVFDWKTSTRKRISDMRRDGVPVGYKIQAQIYAAGLRLQDLAITRCALVFIPLDGSLDNLWIYSMQFDPLIAEHAVDRLGELALVDPDQTAPNPTRLCGWCGFYDPNATDLSVACPGRKGF